MHKEVLLYSHDSRLAAGVGALISVPLSVFSFLLIVTVLSSADLKLNVINWLAVWIFFLATTMFASVSVYGIPRSKYDVLWVGGDVKIKKVGRNVHQEVTANSSPIKLRIVTINVGRMMCVVGLEAIGGDRAITIASSGNVQEIERLMHKILEICGDHCVQQER